MWAFLPEDMKSRSFGEMDQKEWDNLVAKTTKAKKESEAEAEKLRIQNDKLEKQNKKLQTQLNTKPSKSISQPVDLPSGDLDKWKLMVSEFEAIKEKYEFDSETYQNFWKGLNISLDKIILWAKSKV